MEPETDQKIRKNRKLQKKAIGKDRTCHAQQGGDRPDAADHVGNFFCLHGRTLIQIAPLWQFFGMRSLPAILEF